MGSLPRCNAWRHCPPLGGVSLALALLAGAAARAEDRVVYTNDFNGPLQSTFPEWSSRTVVRSKQTVPQSIKRLPPPPITNADSLNKSQRYLGPFGGPAAGIAAEGGSTIDHDIRLSLKDLGPHAKLTVSFDLYLFDSWDGCEMRYGPDRWFLSVVGGPTLLNTSFANWGQFPQDYPRPKSLARTGAVANNTLGSTFGGDSTYHLTFTFPHSSETVELDFRSILYEGLGITNESWGLDNVEVKTEGTGPTKPSGSGSQGFLPLVHGEDPKQFQVVGLIPGSVFIQNDVIRLSGEPTGYIATREEYWDYTLQFEWMYERPRGYKQGSPFEGSSGLLLHIQDPTPVPDAPPVEAAPPLLDDAILEAAPVPESSQEPETPQIWPRAIKIQVWHKPQFSLFAKLHRVDFKPKKDDHAALGRLLKPVGQWNRYEVTSRSGTITLKVNGLEIANGAGVDPSHGKIGFTSEGAPIRFRNIKIKRLD